ncbi:hypothetical protein [Domibacillus antri]|nr:hypothetical protein [Domibacillus antri]
MLFLITFIVTAKLYAMAIVTLDPQNPPRSLAISAPQSVVAEKIFHTN